MLRKIQLYGPLAEFVGHQELEAKADTVGEAIRFLLCNWPALEQHMADQYYKIEIGSWNVKLDEIAYPSGTEPIRIIPVVEGAGGGDNDGSFAAIALGAILIGTAIASGGATLGLAGFSSTAIVGVSAPSVIAASTFAVAAGNIGIGLVLSGVAGLLTPTPGTPDSDSDAANRDRTFTRIAQTAQAGTTIPVVYGEIFTGSIVISAKTKVNLDEGDDD